MQRKKGMATPTKAGREKKFMFQHNIIVSHPAIQNYIPARSRDL
jgi:hypothetical protein